MEKWKCYRKHFFNDVHVQLYNLEKAIQKQTDVSDQNPEIIQKIESIFAQKHNPVEKKQF
jgi:hypothetical protein